MGHGCHDCGVPNGCECKCNYCQERLGQCVCTAALQARQAKHIMSIATVAAALPVDHEADRRVAAMLKKSRGELTGRKLISQADIKERVRLIRLSLHADDVERATVMIDDLAHRLGIQ